jgi:uncharacterized membrane protein
MRVEVVAPVLADPSRVWEVLADLERWPSWTASVRSLTVTSDGPVGIGTTVRIDQPGFPAAVWTITEWSPGRSFAWESRAPGAVSTGVHEVEASDGGCHVRLVLEQRGALAPVLALVAGRRTRRYVDMELAGLKAASEQ